MAQHARRPFSIFALLVAVGMLLGAPRATEAGLIAHLAFDDPAGSAVATDSAYGHDGALVNMNPSTDWVAGKVGGGLDLDGNLDYVRVSAASRLDFGSGDFSVSIWVKKRATSSGTWDNVWGVNKWNTGGSPGTNEWTISLGSPTAGDAPSFTIESDESGAPTYAAASTQQVSLNAWHHIVGVRSDGSIRLYVDGEEKASNNTVGAAAVNNAGSDLYIGAAASGTNYCTNMVVDELQIYDQALTPSQVGILHNSPASVIADPVKVYWAWNTSNSNGRVQRANLDGSGTETLYSPTGYPAGVALDPSTGKVYYTLAGSNDVRRCDLDGGGTETLIANTGGWARGIELDLDDGKMYWAQSFPGGDGKVLRANLNGSGMQTLFDKADGLMDPSDIELDLATGTFYCTDFMSRTSTTDGAIYSGNMDGSGALAQVSTADDPRGLALDLDAGKLYWTDFANGAAGAGRVRRSDLNGSAMENVITGLSSPQGITLDLPNGLVYWSDTSSGGSIRRATLADGGDVQTIVTGIGTAASDVALLIDPVPEPWRSDDVGSPAKAGYAVHHAPTGRFVVDGAGSDISGPSDQFQFVHQEKSGDFTMMARVWSQENTDEWAKAGLMARDGTAANAKHVSLFAYPEHGIRIGWRTSTGATSGGLPMWESPNSATDGADPAWLIIRRRGDTFYGYYADDVGGQPGTWSGPQAMPVSMAASMQIGMAVTSHNTGQLGTGIFDGVKVGNWEPRGHLELKDGRLAGSAYALDDANGDGALNNNEVADAVDWSIRRADRIPGLQSDWLIPNRPNVAGETNVPKYSLIAPNIARAARDYPAEVMAGEGINPGDDLDYFSVRYSGQIFADHTGTFAFQEAVDDQCFLFIDGELVLTDNRWNVDVSAAIHLTEGPHDIEFYSIEGVLGDMAYLRWDPTGGTDFALVPAEVLGHWELGDVLAQGNANVGGPLGAGFFDSISTAGESTWYQLTVSYLGEEHHAYLYVPEPATCLLVGGGLLALLRRRRKSRRRSLKSLACLLIVCGLVAPALASPYSDYVISNTGPVIYYDLNETAGPTATDLATPAGANNGLYGGTIAPGAAGPRPSDGFNAMAADNHAPSVASNGYVLYGQMAASAGIPTGSYSLQTWFNSSADPLGAKALQYLYTRGNGTAGGDRRDGAFVMGSYVPADTGKMHLTKDNSSPSLIGARVLEPNTWYHVAFVRDDSAAGTKAKVYVNGKLEIEDTAAWQGGTGENFVAGHRTDYHTGYGGLGLTGSFDEVAVWDRPLADTEVRNLYRKALGIADPYPAAVMAKSSEAYWRLNETTGNNTAADLTGNDHTFTYNAAPTRTGTGTDVGPRPTDFGGFDADNNAPTLIGGPLVAGDGFVGTPTGVLPGQNDYSVDMWVRPGADVNLHGDYLLHRNDTTAANKGDFLGLTSSGGTYEKLFIYDGANPSVHGATTLNTNEWYHVGVTRQGNDVTVYLNGQVEIPTTTMAPTGTHTNGTWTFGGRLDLPGQQKFAGNMDEIAVYNGALTARDIEENYLSATVNRSSPYARGVLRDKPEAYWRLDETEPYSLGIDATANGHTMDLHATPSRTGTGTDVGPRSPEFGGFEADNNAPRLTGGPRYTQTDGYVGTPGGVLAGQNDYSAEMWFRAADVGSIGAYLMHRNDLDATGEGGDYLGVKRGTSPDDIRLFAFNGVAGGTYTTVAGDTSLSKNDWYHVGMVRDGNDVTVYLNGLPEIQTTLVPHASTTKWTGGEWAFGGRSYRTDLDQRFNGNIDEIAIYGEKLSTVDFQENYCTARIRTEARYPQAVLADGPEAYWRLDEVKPYVTAVDATGNGHTFLYHDAATRTGTGTDVGPRGGAFSAGFEPDNNAPKLTGGPRVADDGYLGIPGGVLPGENDYSVEMWVRLDQLGSLGAYLMHRSDLDASGSGGDFLGLRNGDEPGEINLFLYNGSWPQTAPDFVLLPGDTDILEDEWYHLGMTRAGNDVKVYLNGVLEIDGEMILRAGTKWTDGTWAFGGRTDIPTHDQRFNGNIDELAIYRGALDGSVFMAHWSAAVPEPASCLLLGGALLALARRRRRVG